MARRGWPRRGRGKEEFLTADPAASANASPPARTHSWLSINIVVDSTLARSLIELSFRSDGQIAWVAFSIHLSPLAPSLSLFLPLSRPVYLFYDRGADDATFGAHFLLYIIERYLRRVCTIGDRFRLKTGLNFFRHVFLPVETGWRGVLNSLGRTRIVWASAVGPQSGRPHSTDCTHPRQACAVAP